MWIKVIKTGYICKNNVPQETMRVLENNYTERAKTLLHRELAAALEIKEEEVGQYDIDKLFIVITTPHVAALPVKNHGEWFKPPKLHLNKPVEDDHPATLATLGFEFYSAFLANVEAEFFAG